MGRPPRCGGVGIGWAVTVLVQVALVLLDVYEDGEEFSLEAVSLFQVALWFGLFGVPVWIVSNRGLDWSTLGLTIERRDILPGLAIGVFAQALLVPALYAPILFSVTISTWLRTPGNWSTRPTASGWCC